MKYNLENLHWREFERLVIFYLKEKIGEGLWSFDGTQDMGRDAAFNGKANEYPSRSDSWRGDWIFQTKHRTTRRKTLGQIRKMKKSNAGRQIIENHLVDPWERVKRHRDFARNRHNGMVKSGYWKSKPRIGIQTSILNWSA